MTTRHVLSFVAASIFFVGTVAQAQQPPAGQPAQPGEAGRPGQGMPAEQPGADQASPENVLGWMHHLNQHEIAAAKLAQKKAKSNDVKQYARMLVKDHQKLDSQVMSQAKRMRLDLTTVAMPPEDLQKQQALMLRLEGLEGSAFDREFVQAMQQDHQQAVDKINGMQAQITSAQVKQITKKALPTLRSHATRAQKLSGRLPAGS